MINLDWGTVKEACDIHDQTGMPIKDALTTVMTEHCIGDCDKCQYVYYKARTNYFYDEPLPHCSLAERTKNEVNNINAGR